VPIRGSTKDTIMTTTLEQLRDRVTGSVTTPGDAGYEDARHVHNFMIDAHPAAVVTCTSAEDVAAVVDHARDSGADLAVRGGAHSVPGFGTADDAVVADLSGMRWVSVDPAGRLARIGGGATLNEVNAATQVHGLATPAGIIGTTGIGGLTLGGGIGYLARSHGLSVDNLESAQVVTADGRVREASDTQNPDLYWAIRGGGGNFGVVTEFRMRLHPVGTVLAGPQFFELGDAPAVLRHFRDFIAGAPREYGGFPLFNLAPPLPFIPEHRVGEPFVGVMHCWTGDEAEGAAIVDSFREVATPMAEHVGVLPFADVNALFDGLVPRGLQHYWKAAFVTELTDEAIRAHVEHAPGLPAVNSTMHIYPIDGACHDVAPEDTAFGHREASFATVIAGMWPDPDQNEPAVKWVKDYYAAIAPYSEPGGYINFAAGDDQGRVADNFGSNYARLREVKRVYDPGNLFHLNQNIVP
jgi:FAD/FMN-containing dehydrogenase